MIGDYDILIATTAIEATIPIITDNINRFNHIEGLTVETFRF
jgi:predicted nucleic acid-binding protein